jgi:hypothetical protein
VEQANVEVEGIATQGPSASLWGGEPTLTESSRNPAVSVYKVWFRGYEVPYVLVYRYPVDAEGNQVYPRAVVDSKVGTVDLSAEPHHYDWSVSLDERWLFDFKGGGGADPQAEILRVVPMLADAMAVAAGYACHGSSNRRNPHGPVLTFGAETDPPQDIFEPPG